MLRKITKRKLYNNSQQKGKNNNRTTDLELAQGARNIFHFKSDVYFCSLFFKTDVP